MAKLTRREMAERAFDRASVKAVTFVADRIVNGGLHAYDCIDAARDIKKLMVRTHNRVLKRKS